MGLSMLSIEGLKVAYGHVEALRGIDMTMKQGEITAIIGSNGAGKTSALMAISGLAPVTAGDIRFEGQTITRRRPHDITRLGITHILEGRQLFADQTVEDNLLLGGYTRLPRNRVRVAELMEREMTRFPILRERRRQCQGARACDNQHRGECLKPPRRLPGYRPEHRRPDSHRDDDQREAAAVTVG